VQEAFGVDNQLKDIARAFTWLGAQPRPCTSFEVDELLVQAKEKANNLGRISCSCDLPLCSHLKHAQQLFDKSAVYLKASSGAGQYTSRIDAVLSDRVHSCLDEHLARAEHNMRMRVFDDVKRLLLTLPRWQHVHLSLDVEKRQQRLRDAIDLYVTLQADDVMWHLDNNRHKSMQGCIDGLMGLRDTLGLNLESPSVALAAMNRKIVQRIGDLAAAGRQHVLSEDPLAVAQLAHSLIRLGSIWSELLHFKPMAEEEIKEMLELCVFRKGERITHLRDYLMNMTRAEGVSEIDEVADGTKTRAAVAMRLLQEFDQLHFCTLRCWIWAAFVDVLKAAWSWIVWPFTAMWTAVTSCGSAAWNGSVTGLRDIRAAVASGSVYLQDSMNGSTVVSILAVLILDMVRTWIKKPRC